MVGGSSSSIAVSTKSTGTESGNTLLNLEQFYQTQSKERQMKMDPVQEQFNHQVMKTSRINTFGEKYSRINGQRHTYEDTNAMNYIKVNVFSTDMFCFF
jgi:uncharacterized lipoprotein YehR (DUF1307 family)